MDLRRWMADRGGVVRVSDLRGAGFSKRTIAAAVDARALTRPRGGWVALTDADPMLVAAARAGVVLTCVTQAVRRGLWVLDDGRPHVGAPPHSSGVSASGAVVHWNVPWVPRVPGALEDPIENVLQTVSVCQPFERALAVWESALRTGAAAREVVARLPLGGQAVELLRQATPFSDSGLETFVLVRLKWLHLPVVPQVWIAGRRVDFLIGDRLVLQVDGGHHVGAQREADIAHDALLMTMGYHVVRVGYGQVVERWPSVQDTLLRAVAQGLHLAR